MKKPPDDDRVVPEGRLGRLGRLGLLGLSTGARILGRGKAETTAAAAAEVLGTLRGLAAKMGQIASYVDGFVPEEHRGAVEKTLGALRSAAPTSSFESVRARIEVELGAPIDELFVDFEAKPFASASIGQVHRAKLPTGEVVAVKVQHPGIDRAVLADLDNASVLESLLGSFGGRKLGSKEAIAEVRTRFLEELDYGLEADRQKSFRRLFEGDPTIAIPRIFEERSSARVLTSELHHGEDLEAAARAPEALRRSFAETLWRFVFCGNLVGGMFNADPHPGNYLFVTEGPDAGRVTFLDFGCVQPLSDDHVKQARKLHRAAVDRDEAAFAEACRGLLGTTPGRYEDWALDFSRACFDPMFNSPFRMTRDVSAKLVTKMRDMKRDVMSDKHANFSPLPPGMLFMNRLQFGFYSVLARLDVEVDYAAIERGLLERVDA